MRRLILTAACALAFAPAAEARAQQVYTNDGIEYALELPNATWRTVPRSDNVHEHVEFIYQDRSDALLRVRKEVVREDAKPSDLAERDREHKWRYQNGFVEGKTDNFAGRLSGITTSYEYTAAGKPMTARVYYLRVDPRTVYVLHFTGRRETLLQLRAQTDSIARSFRVK
jgi:hypothetical protein